MRAVSERRTTQVQNSGEGGEAEPRAPELLGRIVADEPGLPARDDEGPAGALVAGAGCARSAAASARAAMPRRTKCQPPTNSSASEQQRQRAERRRRQPDARASACDGRMPATTGGGRAARSCARRTEAAHVSRLLVPQQAAIGEVGGERNREVDRRVQQHHERHRLERLAGLAEHRAADDLHDVRVADRRGQRRRLGKRLVLARRRPAGRRAAPAAA